MEDRFYDLYNESKEKLKVHPAEALRSTPEGLVRRMKCATLLATIHQNECASVIDVGCGFGELAHYLPASVLEYRGFDLLPWVVEEANAKSELNIVQGNITELAGVIPPADTVYALGVLATVAPDDLVEFLNALAKCSQGGIVVSFLITSKYVTDEGFYTYELSDILEALPEGYELRGMLTPAGGVTTICYLGADNEGSA